MTRSEFFVRFIEAHGIARAVEVGTLAGAFASDLLQARTLKELFLVDTWKNPAYAEHRKAAYRVAENSQGRIKIIEKSSVDAARDFADESIGLVYIDAQHEYPHIREDIEVWWRVARRFLAGHDYALWNTAANAPNGVVPAVEEFAARYGLDVWLDGRLLTLPERLKVAYQATVIKPDILMYPNWICEKKRLVR